MIHDPTERLLGHAAAVEALRQQIRRLASFDTPGKAVPTVLLVGETGTGKGLAARLVHDSGPRAGGAFVDVNCAAIPEAILEAELFGFEAGAFTDAKRSKPGLFEAASGGTLFLDEIDALTAAVQSKVLKAIEEKQVRRLGAVEPRSVDVKLIAATQHDLKVLVSTGRFRADLYHRLAVLVLRLPALRERPDDVALLVNHFLHTHAAAHGLTAKRLDAAALTWLQSYPWPGNVRELAHVAERLTLLGTTEEISPAILGTVGGLEEPMSADAPLSRSGHDGAVLDREGTADPRSISAAPLDGEVSQVRAALARSGGNVVRAAKLLGIGRNALRYRMRRLGIERDDGIGPAIAPTAPPVLSVPGAPAPAAWEEKPVAVLVLALAFPEPADDAAYEPWTEMQRWERAIAERIEGFRGVVLARAPSRVTAVFGVPRALEQSPQRAVQAALAIQHAPVPTDVKRPEIRASVHVGEIRVDTAAPNPLQRLLAVGDTFTLAEQLVGHAGRDELLVSTAAARALARSCTLVPRPVQLGPSEADRMTVHAVAGPATVAAEASADSGVSAFVGRNRELDMLCEAFTRSTAARGEVVFVAGDAGIGKTRLLAEFRQRLSGQPHRWIEGHCASYGTGTPFLPIIDGLRRVAGIQDYDDDAGASAKLRRELQVLGDDLDWTLPFVQQLLSLQVGDERVRGLDSASRRSEMFRALRALTIRASEIVPVVLVIEDLHWIDPASEEYLAFISDLVPTASVLLVLTHRTEYAPRFAARSFHTRLALLPLSRDDAAAMTGNILGTTEIPEAVRTLIAQKAEGNPFFVEELTKSLVEDGTLRRDNGHLIVARPVEATSVPDTIQHVLLARLDRLAEDSRRAIQVASVIGREFALRLLARISEIGDRIRTQVEELRSLELIYEKALHPELAYMFKHALTHDVAYESVVRERRKVLHRTIGLAIEELYADRLPEHYETLAHHFGRAEEWERALRYCELSAEKAAEIYSNRAVADHCLEALAIADRLGPRTPDGVRCRLNERLAQACFYLSEFAASGAAYERAAQHSDDALRRLLLTSAAGFSYFWAHHYDVARRCTDDAFAGSRREGIPAAEAMALTVKAFRRGVYDGRLDDCKGLSRQALAICERHPYERTEALATFNLVLVAEWTGDYAGAIERAAHGIAMGRKLRLPEVIIFCTWFLGKARCCTGDFGGAIALLDEAHDLCDRIGDRAWKSRMLNTLGWVYAEAEAQQHAQLYNERAATLAREIGDPEILSNANINLSLNYLALGEVARASDWLAPVEAIVEAGGDPWMRWRYGLHAQHARAEIELAHGNVDRALALADVESAGARHCRGPKIQARALLLRGRACLAADSRDEAAVALVDALTIAEDIGYRRGIWQAQSGLAQLARRRGKPAEADARLAQARAAADIAAQSLQDAALRQGLLHQIASP